MKISFFFFYKFKQFSKFVALYLMRPCNKDEKCECQFDPTGLILTKVIELTTPDIYYYKLIIITQDCNFTSMSFSYVYVLAFYFISFGEKSMKNLTIKRKEKNSDKRRRVIIYYRNYLSDAFSSPPPLPPFPDIMKLKCC